MGEQTAISWTDHTFNPWVGCTRVSPGCQNCYAEALDQRWAKGAHWGKSAPRRVTSDANWRKPTRWNRDAQAAGRPALVFCASMADVFEDRADLIVPRERLFDLIESTPSLIWLLLTKRPQNVLDLSPLRWTKPLHTRPIGSGWPANVWVGTTVEDQARADERIPHLLRIPAPVRFLSCEPLLGPVDLRLWCTCHGEKGKTTPEWVIVGGESGPGHRPIDPAWAMYLRDQCADADVPFFFKQHGGRTPTAGGHQLDGRIHHAWPKEAHR